jgi:anti-anti-sigma factor
MAPFTIEIEQLPSSDANLAMYRTKGKLSLETVSEFGQKMRGEGSQNMVLDLSGITFLDSAGVGALVSLFVNRRNQKKTLALAGLSPQATAVVTVAGLQNLLPIFKTVEEAAAKKL